MTGLMVNPNFAGSMMVGPRRATGISRTMARGFLRCGTDGIGKSIRKSAACPKDRIRLPCKGSIPRVPEMITHGMKVGAGRRRDEQDSGFLFGNDASEPLLHVTACPQEENVAEDCEEVTWTDDASLAGKWLCHGKNSAQEIFEQNSENYLNATTCYVGKDGKLRVGVKMSGVTWGAAWVVF